MTRRLGSCANYLHKISSSNRKNHSERHPADRGRIKYCAAPDSFVRWSGILRCEYYCGDRSRARNSSSPADWPRSMASMESSPGVVPEVAEELGAKEAVLGTWSSIVVAVVPFSRMTHDARYLPVCWIPFRGTSAPRCHNPRVPLIQNVQGA